MSKTSEVRIISAVQRRGMEERGFIWRSNQPDDPRAKRGTPPFFDDVVDDGIHGSVRPSGATESAVPSTTKQKLFWERSRSDTESVRK
jgi:hypothetical protein